MDYSKYKYEQEQKAKLARKHQSTITIKEIKLRPKIDPHDYATKKGHVVRFLKNRDKVKVTIMFRGREMTHPERGRTLLLRLADDIKELGIIESEPLQDGRNMVMMLAPVKEVQLQPVRAGGRDGDEAEGAEGEVAADGAVANGAVEAGAVEPAAPAPEPAGEAPEPAVEAPEPVAEAPEPTVEAEPAAAEARSS